MAKERLAKEENMDRSSFAPYHQPDAVISWEFVSRSVGTPPQYSLGFLLAWAKAHMVLTKWSHKNNTKQKTKNSGQDCNLFWFK